ncbi:caspase family protein [Hufsiella ginkgonis]|uniref:Peptidase C14 caspase domain-containing protein n=1 Tax=Hufsiella ginkgonis TaxID=2695274 RepID=A0A7K1XZY6_9SPHI|nr:caspase family protein [Hufsiella ginkgonis]MXV16502.1 hypothetical protein [Hufsiella ginkgonis]
MKRALVVCLGEVYTSSPNYDTFSSLPNKTRIVQLLSSKGWDTIDPVMEWDATKSNVKASLTQLLSLTRSGDCLLFYYNGHAEKNYAGAGETGTDDSGDEFLVTYSDYISRADIPMPSSVCFLDNEYYDLLFNFFNVHRDRFLISIFDCCYSAGMVDAELRSLPNHMVLNSSSESVSSWTSANDGSYFTKALCFEAGQSTSIDELFQRTAKALTDQGFPSPVFIRGALPAGTFII